MCSIKIPGASVSRQAKDEEILFILSLPKWIPVVVIESNDGYTKYLKDCESVISCQRVGLL